MTSISKENKLKLKAKENYHKNERITRRIK